MSPIEVINGQCLEVIRDIVENNGFATIEKVILVLLERYALPSFDHLRVGPPLNVPALNWLINISTKVSA
jgi:hypothetical protein